MDIVVIYLLVSVAVLLFLAWRMPGCDVRTAVTVSLLWALFLVLILSEAVLGIFGVEMEVQDSNRLFWLRKCPNQNYTGFAVTVALIEFQFFKKRKI